MYTVHICTLQFVLSSLSRIRSYKKEDEPLLNLTSYGPLLKREGTFLYTKEGTTRRVTYLNTGGLNKTGGIGENVYN
jgi:hypothetical protein